MLHSAFAVQELFLEPHSTIKLIFTSNICLDILKSLIIALWNRAKELETLYLSPYPISAVTFSMVLCWRPIPTKMASQV